MPPLEEPAAEARDRVLGAPLLQLGLLPVRHGIALVVTAEAIGHGLDEGRPLAAPRLIHGLGGRGEQRRHVVPVHAHPAHPVGGRALGDGAGLGVDGLRRELGVAVVLADEDHRQVPHARQVQRLVHRPRVGGAVAEEGRRHLARAADPRGQRRAHRDGQARADHAVGAEDPVLHVAEVHGAALAPAVARGAAEQLGHDAAGIGPLGKALAVAAVGGAHEVRRREERADRRRRGLLPHAEVDEAGDLAGGEAFGHPFLEATDQAHHPVDREALLPRRLPHVASPARRLSIRGAGR